MTIFKFYLLRHFSTNQKDSNGFKVIRGQGQGQEMTSVPLGTIFTVLELAEIKLQQLHQQG